jgi:hypothetical protein
MWDFLGRDPSARSGPSPVGPIRRRPAGLLAHPHHQAGGEGGEGRERVAAAGPRRQRPGIPPRSTLRRGRERELRRHDVSLHYRQPPNVRAAPWLHLQLQLLGVVLQHRGDDPGPPWTGLQGRFSVEQTVSRRPGAARATQLRRESRRRMPLPSISVDRFRRALAVGWKDLYPSATQNKS